MNQRVWLPYNQMQISSPPVRVRATKGVELHLEDGRVLIDGISSWWTACHGYNHPAIRAAVAKQHEQMPHVMLGGLIHRPVEQLAERLAALLPGELNHCFFSESGSVSVEVALKMAIQFWLNQGRSGRHRFVSFRYGYHGDTAGAMSVCDPEEGMHSLFAGLLPQQLNVDLPRSPAQLADFEAFLQQHLEQTAGVIMEPLVQAAGGMKFHSPEVLAGIAEICARHDVLLILDEIATGFGRTGTLFACEQAGIVPDIITLSKALTGGTLPLAVTVATGRVFRGFLADDPEQALMHGPTFSGNPLGCAAALASLELFETEPRLDQARAMEAKLASGLASCSDLPGVVEARARGAIGAVQLARAPNLDRLRNRFVELGVWVRPFGDVVYLMPALNIDDPSLERLTDAVNQVVREWSQGVL